MTSRLCRAETACGMLLKTKIQITSVIFFRAFIKSINVDVYCLYALIEILLLLLILLASGTWSETQFVKIKINQTFNSAF